MNIMTTFENTGDAIVARIPSSDGVKQLIRTDATWGETERAIRQAYAWGRADERRQTAGVLRGLMATA